MSTNTDGTLEYTSISAIPQKVARLRSSFKSGKLANVDYRLDQLRNLYFAIKDNETAIKQAIKRDLNKSDGEAQLQELNVFYADIIGIIDNLKNWVKPSYPSDVSILFKFSSPRYVPTPLGVVLVIGAFNYPLILNLQPVIAAISAGNTVVLKQSELSPHTTSILSDIVSKALDPDVLQIVNGAIEETTAILNEKFDKIIYTGSTTVGKIIAKKAAETLTPVLLELGGKNPTFVTEKVGDLDITVKRLIFGKFVNSGQVCVTGDFAFVHESVYDEFVEKAIYYTKQFFGSFDSKTFNKIVNQRNLKRLESTLEQTKGKIVYQHGEVDYEERYFPLTLVKDVEFTDSLMQDELFGPILPIVKYSNLDDAIELYTTHHDTPLSLIIYSKDKKEIEHLASKIRSGSVDVNESLIHVGLPTLPFGGVGTSGSGSYHSKFGFDAFSHQRSYIEQPFWVEPLFGAKYESIKKPANAVTNYLMTPTVKFSRTGKVHSGGFKFSLWFHGIFIAGIAGFLFKLFRY